MRTIDHDLAPEIRDLTSEEIYGVLNANRLKNRYSVLWPLLQESFRRFPERIAVLDEEAVRYKDLLRFSAAVARRVAHDYAQETYVLVYAHRHWKTVGIILGILQSGKAYVPIPVDVPPERLEGIREAVGFPHAILDCETDFADAVYSDYADNLNDPAVESHDPAYVIFTSGSTGEPKGVEIPHVSVADTIQTVMSLFGLNEFDAVLGISAYTFDLSVFDLFASLASGGTLVILKDNRNPALMVKRIQENGVTAINTVAGAFRSLLDYVLCTGQIEALASLRLVILSGDVVPSQLVDAILTHLPQVDLHIMGGPTEITVWSNDYLYRAGKQQYSYVPYGKPIANKTLFVMKDGKAVVNEEGEIVSGGIGLATHYIGQEETEAGKFWMSSDYGRLYNTGDSGILLQDGVIKISGRIDNQVKVNGYRVELEEIEKHLNALPGVEQSIVALYTENDSGKLVAGVKFTAPGSISSAQMISGLKRCLPDYEIPSSFFQLESIPSSSNQKIDRDAFKHDIHKGMYKAVS